MRGNIDPYSLQVIENENISCQVPTTIVSGSTMDPEFLTFMVNHARISGQICRKLLSVSSFQETPESIMETMSELGRRLEGWKESLPPSQRPGHLIDTS